MNVFLSYNRADDAAVRMVRDALHLRGVETFVDWNDLTAGMPWPAKLERALTDARAVAAFVGPSGFGPWQTREVYFALDLQVSREKTGGFPVIPVLLAGAEAPTGFLALNTWVDLRGGVSENSLAPLLRAIDGAEVTRPALDICPYRDLRVFREEDAALFFGRDESIEQLVQRIDASSRATSEMALVAVVGPSGSGKSSVVMAGVLPALRRQRPPEVVWDYVSFTPGDAPWRRLADALLPLLDPDLSEARRLEEAATLANALRGENGVSSTIQRVLQKSRGTDRLLVVVDQSEELFTLTAEATAREFLRALMAASRGAPMTILLTLRSDYYGKAIALDRDLSSALPAAQVNLGPIRPDELRDVIEKPAQLAGLTFDPGLVDRILDDVGDEPGNLPLLEYALTELWKARAGDRLTFDAYDRIGRVSGALANRANALYAELTESQRTAARRLMMRLVRVTAADEEGADTRRRARREELDEEAWKLVPFFTSSRARLLVASEDTVEVAHETLIRKWDRLRTWLEEDRRFLLWRQQLAVYRAAWVDSGEEGMLLRGALLDEAQKWMRTRRAELSAEDREYIGASAKQVVRSRAAWIGAAAALAIALLAVGAWALYQRSERAVVNRILEKGPEKYVVAGSSQDMAKDLPALIRLGRLPQIEEEIAKLETTDRPLLYAQVAAAARKAGAKTEVQRFVDQAMQEARSQPPGTILDVTEVFVASGFRAEAVALLRDAKVSGTSGMLALADMWASAGDVREAREVIRRYLASISPESFQRLLRSDPALIAACAARLSRYGDRDTAIALTRDLTKNESSPLWARSWSRILPDLATVQVMTNEPVLAPLAAKLPPDFIETARINALTKAPKPDLERLKAEWRAARSHAKLTLASAIFQALMEQRRYAEAEAFTLEQNPSAHDFPGLVTTFIHAGRPDEAARFAERLRKSPDVEKIAVYKAYAELSASLARAGRKDAASKAYDVAAAQASAPGSGEEDESERDEKWLALATALAALGRPHEAWQLASSIEDDALQWEAFLSILRESANQRN